MAEDGKPTEDPLLALVAGGILEPRPTMRKVLGFGVGESSRLAMVVFAAAMSGLGYALTGGITSGMEAAGFPPIPAFAAYLALLFGAFLQYFIIASLIRVITGVFGGKGDRDTSRTTVAWWMFATAPLQLLQALALGMAPPALASLVMLGVGVFMFWLLAAYIAEANGFESTPGTFVAVVGISFAIAMLLSSVLSGMIPAEMLPPEMTPQ